MSESRKQTLPETSNANTSNNLEAVDLETLLAEANNLTEVLQPIVMGYLHKTDLELDVKRAASHDQGQHYKNSFHYQHKQSLFNNFILSYESQAAHIAHNLVWNVNIDETLKFAKENPESLLVKVEIKDPHGQRYYNTPLKILLSLGERNPFECEHGNDFGLAERLALCFADPRAADEQFDEWEKESKTATDITMAPYKQAIDDLCTAIIKNKDLTKNTPWQELFNLKIATDFKDKLKPNPNHVVKAGFSWDIQIFLYFFKVWKNNVRHLGGWICGWYSRKSDFFVTLVYSTLQARMSRGDLCILSKGLDNVVSYRHMPKRFNFAYGTTAELRDVGAFWFNLVGNKAARASWSVGSAGWGLEDAMVVLSKLASSKSCKLGITQSSEPTSHHQKWCVIQ